MGILIFLCVLWDAPPLEASSSYPLSASKFFHLHPATPVSLRWCVVPGGATFARSFAAFAAPLAARGALVLRAGAATGSASSWLPEYAGRVAGLVTGRLPTTPTADRRQRARAGEGDDRPSGNGGGGVPSGPCAVCREASPLHPVASRCCGTTACYYCAHVSEGMPCPSCGDIFCGAPTKRLDGEGE